VSTCIRCDRPLDEYRNAGEPFAVVNGDPVCAQCMTLDDRDDAEMTLGHSCIEYAGANDAALGSPVCDLCGLVLERAGDALVMPQ
jgi:hypothetical protein